jgi:hypothetical protein
MSNLGRLIINTRGETVQIMGSMSVRDETVTLQTMTHEGNLSKAGSQIVMEIPLTKGEATALICKLADAIGYAMELAPRKKREYATMPGNYAEADFPVGDANVITSPETVLCRSCGALGTVHCGEKQCVLPRKTIGKIVPMMPGGERRDA